MPAALPEHAQVVIIGGGAVGCALAWQLTEHGCTDVLLLERQQLTSGTTWHAAGLVGLLRHDPVSARIAKLAVEMCTDLEAEEGGIGFKTNGSLFVASNEARMTELARGAAMLHSVGHADARVISAGEAGELYPLLNTNDLVGAVHIKGDGQVNPTDLTQACSRKARAKGARIIENIAVTGLSHSGRKIHAVETSQGTVRADVVVNCGGMWARDVANLAGASVPLHAAEHFYIVTEPSAKIPNDLPVLRDQDAYAYYKEDAGKLLIGAFEPEAKPWGMDGIPSDFAFETLPEDWDHFMPVLEMAMHRVPLLEEAGIQLFFNGPESFTPDDRFHAGPVPGFDNFFVSAGYNSIGIQTAPAIGKHLAHWITTGAADVDLVAVDPRRQVQHQRNRRYLAQRTSESLGLLYAMHWPNRQMASGRGVRRSAIHGAHIEANACFGEAAGWERPNWYAPQGVPPEYEYEYGRQNWFDYAAQEHRAVREGLGLIDLSSFAKIHVAGRDAEKLLNRVSGRDVAVAPGEMVYTTWLNHEGGIESDLTITRLDETSYLVITGAPQLERDMDWLRRHAGDDAVTIIDQSAAYGVLSIMGPNSRSLLGRLTPNDVSAESFAFGQSREIEFAQTVVRASRVSFVGELGYELYVATDQMQHVYEALREAGDPLGLRHVGFHAFNGLRVEKAFRHYGHDMASVDTPYEAGLGFTVDLKKNQPFVGRDAAMRAKEAPKVKRMVQLRFDNPEALAFHDEPLYVGAECVGHLTSAAYGHTLGACMGLGYVHQAEPITQKTLDGMDLEVDLGGERFAVKASLRAMYDPTGERMRA